jgi:pimeloyl-ACP methyl ester carboxylesterase
VAETSISSGEQFARLGAIKLCYETFGDSALPPLLLVMGLSSQMVMWEDEFCEELASRGFWVIRFDNRDVGRSTVMRDAPVPSRRQLLLRDRRGAAYSLADMAADAAALLGHLEVGAAHVVGASMGGMIAQLIAINHAERVLSLVSIMSTTGNRRVGRPHPALLPVLLRRRPRDRDEYVRDFIATFKALGSYRHPPEDDRLRALAERCYERGVHPAGAARQLAAIITTEDRTPLLARVSVPTTVIHGDSDRLVSPSGGRATASAIPGARLVMIPGMGHDLPPVLWYPIIEEIVLCAQRAREAMTARAEINQLQKEEL